MRLSFAAAACVLAITVPGVVRADSFVAEEGCASCGAGYLAGHTCAGVVAACSSCMSGCPVGLPPVCGSSGVCGGACCWDCSNEEGIDLESLEADAQSKQLYEASLARIKFVGPEDAGVFLQDQRMSTLGPKRSFVVPVDNQSKDYPYEVKVDVVRNGKKYFRRHKITDLRAGMILVLNVEAPKVEEDMPAVIKIDPVTEHPGGKPVAKEGETEIKETETGDSSGT